jgi:excisionase family DNA binding protein
MAQVQTMELPQHQDPLLTVEDVAAKPTTSNVYVPENGAFERLLDVPEAATLLLIHPKTLQAMARAGTVPCIRMGKYWRFRASSLDEWVRNRLQSEQQSRRVQ